MSEEKRLMHIGCMLQIKDEKKIDELINTYLGKPQICPLCENAHFMIINSYGQTYFICSKCRKIAFKFNVKLRD